MNGRPDALAFAAYTWHLETCRACSGLFYSCPTGQRVFQAWWAHRRPASESTVPVSHFGPRLGITVQEEPMEKTCKCGRAPASDLFGICDGCLGERSRIGGLDVLADRLRARAAAGLESPPLASAAIAYLGGRTGRRG